MEVTSSNKIVVTRRRWRLKCESQLDDSYHKSISGQKSNTFTDNKQKIMLIKLEINHKTSSPKQVKPPQNSRKENKQSY